MRISREFLASRVKHLKLVQVLKLGSADIDAVDRLELCPSVHTLLLQRNKLMSCEGFVDLQRLWKIVLRGNCIVRLNGLEQFRALGVLDLGDNDISFGQLRGIQHLRILQLVLSGNPRMSSLPVYRAMTLFMIPGAICVDGFFASASSRCPSPDRTHLLICAHADAELSVFNLLHNARPALSKREGSVPLGIR